ncbi:lipopolysaccharide-induced tumor necrosis factor-alpha factor homolog isoform X2 [Mizuhopecten yessoensis]|uniref:lipopolysaccharide-induced tumor necrosis factor-alpha factor homolog isoform X2 n=1 Tax=Mizuhopecten yessoensis TaxID=6573 RepID=UPI000B458E9A|nr:lipopolysaccharide-induced tumor necrosis factor-alpha factor homolog isoform X2 [Mizuhopecten yessoensis]
MRKLNVYSQQPQMMQTVGQPGMVVVTSAPVAGPPIVKSFRDTPQRMQCPNCSQDIVTVMTFVPGVNTIICCVIIALLGGVLGCFLIPFFMDSCKDVVHNCPNCRTKLGRYTKM